MQSIELSPRGNQRPFLRLGLLCHSTLNANRHLKRGHRCRYRGVGKFHSPILHLSRGCPRYNCDYLPKRYRSVGRWPIIICISMGLSGLWNPVFASLSSMRTFSNPEVLNAATSDLARGQSAGFKRALGCHLKLQTQQVVYPEELQSIHLCVRAATQPISSPLSKIHFRRGRLLILPPHHW